MTDSFFKQKRRAVTSSANFELRGFLRESLLETSSSPTHVSLRTAASENSSLRIDQSCEIGSVVSMADDSLAGAFRLTPSSLTVSILVARNGG